jgi:trans-aconitate methyltransferase
MEARLQRRVQRYGWDLAAAVYESLWQSQLACAQTELIARATLAPGERVLDVACGTGLVAFGAAQPVAPEGCVVGVDVSGQMVDAARRQAEDLETLNAPSRAWMPSGWTCQMAVSTLPCAHSA